MGAVSILAMLVFGGVPDSPAATGPAQASQHSPVAGAVDLARKWGVVTSVRRSREHNRAVGGAPNSFHLHGRAIDIARRPGVRHAEIDAAYRKAGYVLIESLDEGDHSHFAFGRAGDGPRRTAEAPIELAVTQSRCSPASEAGLARRRPDRTDDCAFADEPKPRLRPLGAAP